MSWMRSWTLWRRDHCAVFSSKKVAENDLASAFICVYHSNFRTPSPDLLNSDPYWGASTGRVWHVAPSARGEQCRYVRSWETMLGKKKRSFCYFLSIELLLHFWNHDWTNRYVQLVPACHWEPRGLNSRSCSGAMISQLQKSFLDQLNSECDLNAAAAKVQFRLSNCWPQNSPFRCRRRFLAWRAPPLPVPPPSSSSLTKMTGTLGMRAVCESTGSIRMPGYFALNLAAGWCWGPKSTYCMQFL